MSERDPLFELLAETDAPCPRCGYNLRGARERRCPECGAAFTFAALVRSRRTVGAAWVVGLIALAMCLPESYAKWQFLLARGEPFYLYGDIENMDGPNFDWYDIACGVASYVFWLSLPFVLAMWLLLRSVFVAARAWVRWPIALSLVVGVWLAFRRFQWWWYEWDLGAYPRRDDLWFVRYENPAANIMAEGLHWYAAAGALVLLWLGVIVLAIWWRRRSGARSA